jgi:hypothetical protein
MRIRRTRHTRLAFCAPLLLAAACTDAELDPADETRGGELPERTVRIKFPDGVRDVRYTERNGRAIYDGDIDLGSVDEIEEKRALFGGAIHKDFSRRWPNGVVRFRFDSSVSVATRSAVMAAHDAMEAVTPLKFVNIFDNASGAYLEYRQDVNDNDGGVSDQIGMSGGEQAVTFYDASVGQGLIIHETLHAVGFWHEQSREDRDAWVVIDNDCINWSLWDWENDQKQYEVKGDALELGPYDFRSIMHYSTGTWCAPNPPAKCTKTLDDNNNGTNETWCMTMFRASTGRPIWGSNSMSREDVNMLWRMYGGDAGVNAYGDRMGAALAVGDFDGDQYNDLAVGVPGENDGSGKVVVYRGTSNRLVPWKTLTQASAGWAVEPGDHFGWSLAAGDVDGDGIADLLVGAPHEDVKVNGVDVEDAGGAILFKGSATGFTVLRKLTQTTLGYSEDLDDNFGYAVAIASIAGGSPDLVIGAPGDHHPGVFGAGTLTGGAVYVYPINTDPEAIDEGTTTRLFYAGSANGDRFGQAIATGLLDDGANVDLVIGAPYAGTDHRGAAFVYAGRDPVGLPQDWSTNALAAYKQRITPPYASSDDFGAAIAIGNVRGSLANDLVIGAPASSSSQGRVYVYTSSSTTLGSSSMTLAQSIAQNGSLDAGDRFGASLAVGSLDGSTNQQEIVVGAPGENGGEGAVSIFTGQHSDATGFKLLQQSNIVYGQNEAHDWFGEAVVVGNVNGIGEKDVSSDQWSAGGGAADLVVGVPGEGPDISLPGVQPAIEDPSSSGAISIFHGGAAGALTGRGTFHQETLLRD